MFDLLAPNHFRFRTTTWPSDYGASFETSTESEGREFTPQPFIETSDWSRGLMPDPVEAPESLFFVDGVQRLEAWGVLDDGEHVIDAALASVAVGGVDCGPTRAILDEERVRVERVLAVASHSGPFRAVSVRAGNRTLQFEPAFSSLHGQPAIGDAVSHRRREMERIFAEEALRRDRLVIVDGRLSLPTTLAPIVGMAKTIHEQYLEDSEWRLVSRLAAGERTPVFAIDYESGARRYSWFLRLPFTRPVDHSLAGILRLETSDVGDHEAQRLANLTAYHLPAFASRPEHDPRAPQNLVPIAGLEKTLRHLLDDAGFIQRAIQDSLGEDSDD